VSDLKRGRRPLPPGVGKTCNLGIKTTQELKDKILAAAESSGRSVAQEIELRLERSFQAEGNPACWEGRIEDRLDEILSHVRVFRRVA